MPLPEVCVAALRLRQTQQQADRDRVAGAWVDTGLVFTTRHGTAVEPRNFSRSFDRCIVKAQVRCANSASGSETRRCCTSVLDRTQNGRFPQKEPAVELCGRYWDRTSDLLGVNEALSR